MGVKSKIKSKCLSFSSDKVLVKHSIIGNSNFQYIEATFNKDIDINDIQEFVARICSFYSLVHGYNCYPSIVEISNKEKRKLLYKKSIYYSKKTYDWFNENHRFDLNSKDIEMKDYFRR